MFQSARLTLTAWYLVIIMVISVLFSIAFYTIATQELRRVIHYQEENQVYDNGSFSLQQTPRGLMVLPSVTVLEQSDSRYRLMLIIINGIIFIVAGAAGYFLAGRTLRPIKRMVDEQNQFIADASHELRTPLTALRAEMEAVLLDEKITAKEAKALITSNLEEVISLQSLSDHLLELTTASSNTSHYVLQEMSLKAIAQDVIEKITPLAKKKKISLKQDVSDTTVLADRMMVQEVMMILLDNAMKYSKEGTTVSLTGRKESGKAVITISDEGIGIPKEDVPFIFDRFYQVSRSRTKQTSSSGYGLGLSIAKRIIETFHGTIKIDSEVAKGTIVTVTFPTKE